MLLNLSTHPSATWPDEQKQAALQRYGGVADLPFPVIDPEWDGEQVLALALRYVEQAKALEPRPQAVHIMGELTFVFHFVARMREAADGLPCVASTTRRNVTEPEPGKKLTTFEFLQFRPYF